MQDRLEPIMLKNVPIIPSRTFQCIYVVQLHIRSYGLSYHHVVIVMQYS